MSRSTEGQNSHNQGDSQQQLPVADSGQCSGPAPPASKALSPRARRAADTTAAAHQVRGYLLADIVIGMRITTVMAVNVVY